MCVYACTVLCCACACVAVLGFSCVTCLIVEFPVLDGPVNVWLTLSAHTVHSHVTCLELLMELCKLLEVVLQGERVNGG